TDADSLGVIATTQDSVPLTLHVLPIAGDFVAPTVITNEDQPASILSSVTIADGDGSEVMTSVNFSTPVGWAYVEPTIAGLTFTPGANGTTTITFDPGMSQADRETAMSLITATPPAHSSMDGYITVTVTTVETQMVNGQLVVSAP